jgi:hypothetical protein
MKRIALATVFVAASVGTAAANETANSKWLNSKWLNSKWLNSKWLNTANLNATTGDATFYNPWTGATLSNVWLDKTTFVSSGYECDSETQQCWQTEQRGDAFVGTWTTGTLNDGSPTWTYIAGRWNPSGDQETYLYSVYAWTQDTAGAWTWLPVCADEYGNAEPAIPLAGAWNVEDGSRTSYGGNQFTWACSTGALGKCAASGLENTLGYAPWKSNYYYTPSESPWGYWYYAWIDGQRTHQACTRMIRADYCGNGDSHTFTGNPIDVRDYFYGGQVDVYNGEDEPETWAAEALWNEDGAEWLSCERVGELTSGATLECDNGHYIRNNSTAPSMCFAWQYLPFPEDLQEQQSGMSNLPAFQIEAGEILLGTRTSNLTSGVEWQWQSPYRIQW